jgi:serine/threonine protein kinase
VIGDRYEPIEQIGTGGMATVWRARDTLLGRLVAIKRLLPHLADDPVASARFKREAQAAASLNHPGIVTVFDTGDDEEGPFIVLELVEGATLADHLAASGSFDPGTAVGILSQIASALDHAHAQGVIHRDIKPANIIIDQAGRARIADFGIARTVEDPATITSSGELIGTIAYLAPEILAGQPATAGSDIYSLAAVGYEMLAGAPPYRGGTPAALLEAVRTEPPPRLGGAVPDGMAAAVFAAMAKDPEARPRTAGELASALIGSVTLVMETGQLGDVRAIVSPSEDPTVVNPGLPPDAPAEAVPTPRARWAVLPALVGVLALAAAAMTADQDPAANDGPEPTAPPSVATSSTTSTSTSTSTTNPSTTTTTQATTTTAPAPTPETVAAEIGAILEGLDPPELHPREVGQIEDRLDEAMREWSQGDREDLADVLERAFEEVDDLVQTPERELVRERLIELTELMGFEVEEGDRGAGDRDD